MSCMFTAQYPQGKRSVWMDCFFDVFVKVSLLRFGCEWKGVFASVFPEGSLKSSPHQSFHSILHYSPKRWTFGTSTKKAPRHSPWLHWRATYCVCGLCWRRTAACAACKTASGARLSTLQLQPGISIAWSSCAKRTVARWNDALPCSLGLSQLFSNFKKSFQEMLTSNLCCDPHTRNINNTPVGQCRGQPRLNPALQSKPERPRERR